MTPGCFSISSSFFDFYSFKNFSYKGTVDQGSNVGDSDHHLYSQLGFCNVFWDILKHQIHRCQVSWTAYQKCLESAVKESLIFFFFEKKVKSSFQDVAMKVSPELFFSGYLLKYCKIHMLLEIPSEFYW